MNPLMYNGDRLFDLNFWTAAGLVLVAALLALGMVALTRRAVRGKGLAGRVVVGLALFYAFVWLSPQVWHFYWSVVAGGSPWEAVIGWPPAPEGPIRLLVFSGPWTIAAHAAGVLGWALIVVAVRPKSFGRIF